MSKLTCVIKFAGSVGEEKKCELLTEEEIAAVPEGLAGQVLTKAEDGYSFENIGALLLEAGIFPDAPGVYVFTAEEDTETGEPILDWHELSDYVAMKPTEAGNYILNVDSEGAATYTALPSQAGKYVVTVGANGAVSFSEYKLPEPPTEDGGYVLRVNDGVLSWVAQE